MNKSHKKDRPATITHWLTILCCCVNFPAYAENDYQVELIVFEDANRTYFASENWVTRPFDPDEVYGNEIITPDTIIKDPPADTDIVQGIKENQAFEPMEDELVKMPRYDALPEQVPRDLLNISQSLQASKRYNTLYYGAWLVSDLDDADKITIEMLDNIDPVSIPRLFGDFTIAHRRYLHINTNIAYVLKPSTTNMEFKTSRGELISESEPDSDVIDLIFHRRMRSNEIHFIDHPLVGIIVKIIPYEKIELEPQALKIPN